MATQSAAVMQRMNETEIVERSSEEILNQCSQTHELIARRAFEISETNGGSPGNDLEDWLHAESELLFPIALNLIELHGEYVVRAEVPGFSGRDIKISVEPRCLAISGGFQMREEGEVSSALCANRIFRTLELSSDVDTSTVSATVQDGILTVHLPKKPRM
jgi:HSP20 family molecular chaperone IbpA